ncbi:hypothetical protein Tco_0863260, partial [Tanacetum coccineum]
WLGKVSFCVCKLNVRRAALNAARGHTLDATCVDSSSASAAFIKYDVSRNESWDMVILDPPKLALRRKVLQSKSGISHVLQAHDHQLPLEDIKMKALGAWRLHGRFWGLTRRINGCEGEGRASISGFTLTKGRGGMDAATDNRMKMIVVRTSAYICQRDRVHSIQSANEGQTANQWSLQIKHQDEELIIVHQAKISPHRLNYKMEGNPQKDHLTQD